MGAGKNKCVFCPSVMCVDFGHLHAEVKALEEAGADCLHVDVMDGQYVENFGMGMQDIQFLAGETKIPFEMHLMIMNPQNHLEKFARLGPDIIYIHPDTTPHPAHTLEKIADMGIGTGIVLSPEMSVETVRQLFFLTDYVMVMTVNPGFSGNRYLPYVEEKIRALCRWKEVYGFELEIDGGCSREIIQRFCNAGVSRFVLGTKGLFGLQQSYAETIQTLRRQTEEGCDGEQAAAEEWK